MAKTYYFPPIVIMGPGAIELIVPEIKRMDVQKALIVTDEVLVKVGVVKQVLDVLDEVKFAYALFSDVKSNPTLTHAIEVYLTNRAAFFNLIFKKSRKNIKNHSILLKIVI